MKWIVDADPGIDDAAAIIACLRLGLDAVAITCVHGNSPLEDTVRNALRLKDLLQSDVPVYKGVSRAILEPARSAPEIHGSDGFGDIEWPDIKSTVERQHAVDAIIDLSHDYAGSLGVLATGPLTNIAVALIKDPSIGERISQLVIMGGTSGGRGNTTMVGEFNFAVDPEAAAIVLGSGIPITLVPWETCLHNLVTVEQIERGGTEPLQNRVAQTFFKMADALFERTNAFGYEGLLLCDLIAAAVVLQPTIVQKEVKVFAAVETSGTYGRGLTAIDYAGLTDNAPNVSIVLDVNGDELGALFRRALSG